MAMLKIMRSDEHVNRIRDIRIYLNGNLLYKIGNAETVNLEIDPGRHILQAKIDWCSSNKIAFAIPADGNKLFILSSFAKNKPSWTFSTLLYFITFGANKYLILEEKV